MIIVGVDPGAKNLSITVYYTDAHDVLHYIFRLMRGRVGSTATEVANQCRQGYSKLHAFLTALSPEVITVEDQKFEKYRFIQYWLLRDFPQTVWRKKYVMVNYLVARLPEGLLKKTGKDWAKNKKSALEFMTAVLPEIQMYHYLIDGDESTLVKVPDHNNADSFITVTYEALKQGKGLPFDVDKFKENK